MGARIEPNTHRRPRSCSPLWPCVCKGSGRRWTAGGDDCNSGLRTGNLSRSSFRPTLAGSWWSWLLDPVGTMAAKGWSGPLQLKKDTICPRETSPSACGTQVQPVNGGNAAKNKPPWTHLLGLAHRAVPEADDLYLLVCIAVVLVQLRHAGHFPPVLWDRTLTWRRARNDAGTSVIGIRLTASETGFHSTSLVSRRIN